MHLWVSARGVLLLALWWGLGTAQSLKIKVRNEQIPASCPCLTLDQVVDENGRVEHDFSDSNAAFQERSYLLPARQKDAILVTPTHLGILCLD